MHAHGHKCCGGHAGHAESTSLAVDPRFADDDFTQAAAHERRVRAAHAHGMSLIAMILGGFIVACIVKMICGKGR